MLIMSMKKQEFCKRIFDIAISVTLLTSLLPLMLIIIVLIWLECRKPIFSQLRLGRNHTQFTMFKFRTMYPGTKDLPTHLVNRDSVTKFGGFLRKSKIDEIPQLFNVILGDLSLVGPRPCLPSQTELIRERDKYGLFDVRPGITGLAQLSGVDMSKPTQLAELDLHMVQNLTLLSYFRYLWLTLKGVGFRDSVT